MTNRYEGGDLLVESLRALGVGQIFSVSGGPLNSIYHAADAHGVQLVHTRHEAAAGFMAEAVSRVSGTPGVAAVTLGPGVTNTVTPALVSKMAGTPLLILGAQAGTPLFDRGAGMSADHVPIMAPVTKWSARVLHTERIPEYIEAAWRIMWSGRPGPVFLELPVDALAAPAEPVPPAAHEARRPGLDESGAKALAKLIAGARRPLLIIGDDARWDAPAGLTALVERLRLPFFTLRLARGAIDEHHPLWAGPAYIPANASLEKALGEADLVIVLGHHFEFDLGFGGPVNADAAILQCCVEPDLLGKNRRATLNLLAAPSAVAAFMATLPPGPADPDWIESVTAAWRDERESQGGADASSTPLHPVAAVDAVVDAMPADTVYVTSHGNVDFWADARIRVRAPDLYLRAGQAGALGAEIPYGIGARFARPERPVVVFVGDGGVGYHGMEIDTAARYGRPVTVVVLDDEKWSAIALPQKSAYGGEYEMDLPRRDWPKLAESLGGAGFRADSPGAVGDAVRAAAASGKPAVVQVPVRSVLSPYMANITK